MSVKIAILTTLIIVFCFGHALAVEDCGCGDAWGSDDSSSTDNGTSDSNSQDNSGDTSYDSGSSGSSSDSSDSSAAGGSSSEDGLIWRMKGDDFYNRGLYNESLEAYEKAVTYDPYALKTWTGLGRIYLEQGNPEKAVTAYKKAIKLDPSDPNLYVLLGDAYAADSNYEDAISSYRKALSMKPTITGVLEKIVIAETSQAGINMINSTTPDITAPPETTEPAILQTESASMTMTEAIQPAATPKAALSGIIPGISVLIIGLLIQLKRK